MRPKAYSDEDLVQRAVEGCRNPGCFSKPRWVLVMEIFKLGSTSAVLLCRRFMLDPYEEMPGVAERSLHIEEAEDD